MNKVRQVLSFYGCLTVLCTWVGCSSESNVVFVTSAEHAGQEMMNREVTPNAHESDGQSEGGRHADTVPMSGGVGSGGVIAVSSLDTSGNVHGPAPDLIVDAERLRSDVWVDRFQVDENSCAFKEGCIRDTGQRTLLRFAVAAANIGEADLMVGRPQLQPEIFHYSECHAHFHRDGFATYRLETDAGIIRRGGKYAFCLMDSFQFSADEGVRSSDKYHCGYQGISVGWADDYGSELDCQWVDVTGLEPGRYRLTVDVNADKSLPESDLTNNEAHVDFTLPAVDLEAPCADSIGQGARKACGWRKVAVGRCARNGWLNASCWDESLDRVCDGQLHIRICPGDVPCYPSEALAPKVREVSPAVCSPVEFLCADSEAYSVWIREESSQEPGRTCGVKVDIGEIPLTRACDTEAELGADRACGWVAQHSGIRCEVGEMYRVGCVGESQGPECPTNPVCEGDPLLRVCAGRTMCGRPFELAGNDDACGTKCPRTEVRCPPEGKFSVFVTAHDHRKPFSCAVEIAPL